MNRRRNKINTAEAKATIEKGRRAKWWKRTGSKSRGFRFTDASGNVLTDNPSLERIASLVIPPAWRYVRIAPSASSRIQAVGMDGAGRVQYLYEAKFIAKRERAKFARLLDFGNHLPKLRRVSNADISLDGLPKAKVLAVMTRLINSLYFRVGSEKSARMYRTYGITTLQNTHLHVGRNGTLRFDFTGKSYVRHRKVLVDSDLAKIMKQLKELGPKRKLFCYIDEDGAVKALKPADVNAYLKNATAPQFSSKDFRTWGATLLAANLFAKIGVSDKQEMTSKNVVKVVKRVAEELGNTPAVCRSSYIHPMVIAAYETGKTLGELRPPRSSRIARYEHELEPDEAALLKMLEDG